MDNEQQTQYTPSVKEKISGFFSQIFSSKNTRIGFFIVAALAVPFFVFVAMQQQDIRQQASENGSITFVDATTNQAITETTTPDVKLQIALPDNWEVAPATSSSMNIIPKAYAQTISPSAPPAGQDNIIISLAVEAANTPERPYENATVTLSGNNLASPLTGITNSQGYFRFTNLVRGAYTASFTLPDGYTYLRSNLGSSRSITITSTQNSQVAFAIAPTTSTAITETPTPSASTTLEPTVQPTSDKRILQKIIIRNVDTATGGQEMKTIENQQDIITALSTGTPWKLNPLLATDSASPRIVRVQFYGYDPVTGPGTVIVLNTQTTITLIPTAPSATPIPVDNAINRVFITSTTYSGALGGLAGADAKCQQEANAAQLTGNYKAWLSDGTGSAASRLFHSANPYKLVDGTLVANNWTILTSGGLSHYIDKTATGAQGYTPIWTGTGPTGFSTPENCSNWTSENEDIRGMQGSVSPSNTRSQWWTMYDPATCSAPARLYCIEQPGNPTPAVPTPTTPVSPEPSGNPSTTPGISPTGIIPTMTLAPTTTPVPGAILLNVKLSLQGIGTNGNTTPIYQQKDVTLSVFNGSNANIATGSGKVTYNPVSGLFEGAIDMGAVPPGNYYVKATMKKYLTKTVATILSIVPPTTSYTIEGPAAALTPGDTNGDNKIDLQDYNIYRGCAYQTTVTCVTVADFNDDGHVDKLLPIPELLDYRLFIQSLATRLGD